MVSNLRDLKSDSKKNSLKELYKDALYYHQIHQGDSISAAKFKSRR